ncbi:MAG TPA: glycosyltransferase family 2 protein, partial [Herpetosiphonaceae bacterium]
MMPPAAPPAPGSWPRVTVIILNYNGWRFMPGCLAALAATDYPAEALDILVVDNASHDGSVEHLRRDFPGVRLLALGGNTGFAGGNNAGIRASDAPYVVMLNNDTAVEPGWLKPLVAAAEADPTVGACGSKLLFFYARLSLSMTAESSFVPAETMGGGDTRVLGVRLREAALAEPGAPPVGYGAGWYDREGSGPGAYRWSAAESELIVPVAEPG